MSCVARWSAPVDLKKTKYQSYQNNYQFNATGRWIEMVREDECFDEVDV